LSNAPKTCWTTWASVGPEGYRPTDDDLLAAALGPFFAGLDTVANTSSFMMYALLKHPEVLARVQAEVDQHLTSDAIDLSVFRQMPAPTPRLKPRRYK
jgi:cytochrome P450